MPEVKTRFISHTFNGGWATDLGPTYYGAPEGNTMRLPYLTQAQNAVYEFDGGPHKAPGTNLLNDTVIEASQTVTGVYDYWRLGTAATPAQRRVVHVNDKIYHDGGIGSFSAIASGLEVGAVPHYSTFNDLLIIASNSTIDAPQSWDQSTLQNLAGSPPRFSFSVNHQGKQWASGNWLVPYRLYYTVTGNPEDWVGTGSGSIDIEPGDGDRIVGIFSWKDELWVFKGPNKLSIHRIAGATPSEFTRKTFIRGISAANQSCIFEMGDDIGFVSPRGTIHSLKTTASYGDYNQSYLNYPILSWCRDNMNRTRYQFWQAATDVLRGYTLISFPLSGITNNNYIIMIDWRFLAQGDPYPRFAPWDFGDFASLTYAIDTSYRARIFAGGYDGNVYRLDQSTRTHNNTSINCNVVTPFLTYGTALNMMKTISAASVGTVPKNLNVGTFGWTMDSGAEQTTTFTQNAGAILGTFVLGTDSLGGSQFTQRFLADIDGQFRAIQYRVNDNNDGGDLELHNIGAEIMESGTSLENE